MMEDTGFFPKLASDELVISKPRNVKEGEVEWTRYVNNAVERYATIPMLSRLKL